MEQTLTSVYYDQELNRIVLLTYSGTTFVVDAIPKHNPGNIRGPVSVYEIREDMLKGYLSDSKYVLLGYL